MNICPRANLYLSELLERSRTNNSLSSLSATGSFLPPLRKKKNSLQTFSKHLVHKGRASSKSWRYEFLNSSKRQQRRLRRQLMATVVVPLRLCASSRELPLKKVFEQNSAIYA